MSGRNERGVSTTGKSDQGALLSFRKGSLAGGSSVSLDVLVLTVQDNLGRAVHCEE